MIDCNYLYVFHMKSDSKEMSFIAKLLAKYNYTVSQKGTYILLPIS
jgi:hypothetical protein